MEDNKDKSAGQLLHEKLIMSRKNKALKVDESTFEAAEIFSKDYKKFLDNAKTEREAVAEVVKLAKSSGFALFDPDKKYSSGDRLYVVNRDKNVALIVIGEKGCSEGVKLTIAHIDSPRIDVKQVPLYEKTNMALFKTHYYGGIKKYQWVATPLALHGKVVLKNGEGIDVCIGENDDEPCFCVSDLLPHLASEQMTKTAAKMFTGEDLNVLVGSYPFKDDKASELVKLNIMNILFEKYGMTESDFLSAELSLVPAGKARDLGFDRSMIGAYGHDDRVCAYPSAMAAIDCENPQNTVITLLCDKEEVGSDGNTGIQSAFLKYLLYDLAKAEGLEGYRVISKSKCLSADVGAAYDPNYPSVFEENNSAYMNSGVVIQKYTGAYGKNSTNDASAEFMGEVRQMLDKGEVLWQTSELGKVDGGGGGTIAKYVANLNMEVIDIGVPVLSMHAPFEVVSKLDTYMMYKAIEAFYKF